MESRNGQQEAAGAGRIEVEGAEQGDIGAHAANREEEMN